MSMPGWETASDDAQPPDASACWERRRHRLRLSVFGVVLVAALVASVGWVISRPAIYQANARMFIRPPNAQVDADPEAGVKAAAIQASVLMSSDMIQRLKKALAEEAGSPGQAPRIGRDGIVLRVDQLTETNLLSLVAEGADARQLAPVVNRWLDIFIASLGAQQSDSGAAMATDLGRQQADLEARIAAKRGQLSAFRQKNDIVAMEREQGEAVSRLKAMNEAANQATRDEAAAEADYAALTSAIAAGRAVVRDQDKPLIAQLEKRTLDIGEQLKELRQRFTDQYIALDPRTRVLAEQQKLLTERLAAVRRESQQAARNEARQNLESARQVVATLRGNLSALRRQAATFNEAFSLHEALVRELSQLEDSLDEIRGKGLKASVDRASLLIRADIVERAATPDDPVRPDYRRNALIAAGASFLLALAAALMVDFFFRSRRGPPPISVSVPVTMNQPPAMTPAAMTDVTPRPAMLEETTDDSGGEKPADNGQERSQKGRL